MPSKSRPPSASHVLKYAAYLIERDGWCRATDRKYSVKHDAWSRCATTAIDDAAILLTKKIEVRARLLVGGNAIRLFANEVAPGERGHLASNIQIWNDTRIGLRKGLVAKRLRKAAQQGK